MMLDFVIIVAALYVSIPLVAGYFAYSYGRSFWFWFALSAILPVISHLVLGGLIIWDEKHTKNHELNVRENAEAGRLVRELMKELEERSRVVK